jgi:hypothetical protein
MATATKYGVDRRTLSRRFLGQTEARSVAHLNAEGHLTVVQEEALIGWIDVLSMRKLPPTPEMIRTYVRRLTGEEVGQNWVPRLFKRHEKRLQYKYLKGIDANRVYMTSNRDIYAVWFQSLDESYKKYRFTPDRVINFNEKGFLLRQQQVTKRYFIRSNPLEGVKQDGSRE